MGTYFVVEVLNHSKTRKQKRLERNEMSMIAFKNKKSEHYVRSSSSRYDKSICSGRSERLHLSVHKHILLILSDICQEQTFLQSDIPKIKRVANGN